MTTDQPAPAQSPAIVALVFGGRSSEHAVSCATAAGVIGRSTATATTSSRSASREDGHWVLARRRPGRTCGSPPTAPPRSRRRRRASSCPSTPPTAPCRHEPEQPPRRSARSTSCSRCCTGPLARTAPSRACSSWPTSAMSVRGSSHPRRCMDKHVMKVAVRVGRAARGAVRRHHRRAVASRQGGRHGCRARALAGRCSSSPRGPGRAWASPRSRRRRRSRRRSSPRARMTPRSSSRQRSSGARSSAACSRVAAPTPAARRSELGECIVVRRPRVLRLRGQVPRRRTPCGSSPRRRAGVRVGRGASAAGRRGVRGARLRGPGPGRLLLHRRRATSRQRDQHDARVHATLDVPADVAGHRAGLPRAHRRADRSSPSTAAVGLR